MGEGAGAPLAVLYLFPVRTERERRGGGRRDRRERSGGLATNVNSPGRKPEVQGGLGASLSRVYPGRTN